ncbi:methyltransferase domain-containing protein [Dactylosporangium sp. NPDC049140]|jgi:2-polyprenyl-6-hydroxyphenyl methylase/3-demethylubiquinone-9 3-methyltransferase|uniref:methyltransferase domain-containing protein n=1 Tax=Dactylosporangium sp. NPDC049140 TaxID=3155647 RepID=UPI0033EFBEE7
MPSPRRARNDPGQYDDLAGEWWRPGSPFSMLHWIAGARARLIPPAERAGAVLVDLGCGGGLLAPHVAGKGYTHVGVDLILSGLEQAAAHGVAPVRADVAHLPFADGSVDVVSAGELLEHVPDMPGTVAEACRILRPGGWLVLDTLNDTALSRLVAVRLAEAVVPAVRGIHDPALFVDPRRLRAECARHGVPLDVRGVRPALPALARWLVTRRGGVPIVPTFSTAILYQGRGRKERQ